MNGCSILLEVIALPSYHYINTKYHNDIMQIGDIYAALCTIFECAWKGSCNNLSVIHYAGGKSHTFLKGSVCLQGYGN